MQEKSSVTRLCCIDLHSSFYVLYVPFLIGKKNPHYFVFEKILMLNVNLYDKENIKEIYFEYLQWFLFKMNFIYSTYLKKYLKHNTNIYVKLRVLHQILIWPVPKYVLGKNILCIAKLTCYFNGHT